MRGHKDAVWGVEFSPDGGGLYSAGADHEVRYWDARPGPDAGPPDRNTLTGHEGRVTGLAFHPRAPILASVDMRGAARVWDARAGTLVRRLSDLPGQAHCAAFRPDGRRLAVGVWAA
jgi:WD40 repeat protein